MPLGDAAAILFLAPVLVTALSGLLLGEHWLADKWQSPVGFKINDALNKLLALKLVNETDGQLSMVPIQQGIKNLDQRWDGYKRT